MKKQEIAQGVNGNEIKGRAASRFFELRGFANRKPNQGNVGDCMIWSALKNAAEESQNAALIEKIKQAETLPV